MYKIIIISYPPSGIPSGKFPDESMYDSANSDLIIIPNIEQNSQNEICIYKESLSHAFVPPSYRSFRLVVNMKGI